MDNRRKKIILVDDIKSSLEQGRIILNPYFQVFPATSAEKMFKYLDKILPDLILMDIEMPDMNGYEALKALKAKEQYADIPVIFLTAKSDVGSEREGFDLGAADYMVKPFSAPLLLKRIENQLLIAGQKKALINALREAEQASDTKSSFLANMSHEMRTPLNAIIGLTGLTLENEGLSGEIRGNMEKIYNAGTTLLNIVNDVLDISKIEAGKLELVEIDYDLPSMINDAITQNILRIGEKPVTFILNVNEGVYARLYGDELRVKQIINNLLSNAIKYTQEGTVELNLDCEREGDEILLSIEVRDTGKGIRLADIEKLFFDYSQADVKANRKIEGTGLGLPITKKLAEMMKGTVSVESEYGKGSKFTVKISQAFVSDARIDQKTVDNLRHFRYSDDKRNRNMRFERIKLPYARVLVVDDNETNLDVAKGLMKPYRMKVDCVTSAQEAINIIRSESFRGEKVKYDAIFLDHMMPDMDGIEAVGLIRGIGTDYAAKVPVIALTANAVAGNREMFLGKGFQDFISKPIDLQLLDEVIRRWIRDKAKEKSMQSERAADNEAPGGCGYRELPKIPGMDAEKRLSMLAGDMDIYLAILRSYAKNTPAIIEKLRDTVKSDLPGYAIYAHSLKGSSASVGADGISAAARELELKAKAGDLEGVLEKNDRFLRDTEILINSINDWFKKHDVKPRKPILEAPDRAVLAKLRQSLIDYDIKSVDDIMSEVDDADYDNDTDLIPWLHEKITAADFDDAVRRISDILAS